MCDLHMHMGRYDHQEVVLTLLRSIRFQSYALESQIRKAEEKGQRHPLLHPSFELNQRVLLLHFGIRT